MVIALVLISVFMSLMFPTIYGIALGEIERVELGGRTEDEKMEIAV